MTNLSNIWNKLKEKDLEISNLYKKYKRIKKERMDRRVPGRRVKFDTSTELVFPLVLGTPVDDDYPIQLSSLSDAFSRIIMSTDGVYALTRASFEVYLEQKFENGTERRETLVRDLTGFYSTDVEIVTSGVNTQYPPIFDFMWNVSTGSNQRSYSKDLAGNLGYSSRRCLMGGNSKQFEFGQPYFLDGNEMAQYQIKPILGPFPNYMLMTDGSSALVEANIILNIVTIGHKILGNGHVIPGAPAHY